MFDLDVSANCPFLLDLILVKSVNNVFLDLYSIGLQVDFIKVLSSQSNDASAISYRNFNDLFCFYG